MDKRPIGIFDSGLGGLTCALEVAKLMPNEDIIYFGDTSRVPYGTRSAETIIKYTRQDINFLLTFDIKMIIIACGTASSTALEHIAGDYDIDILGVVTPSCKEAVAATKNKKIGVIGTQAAINSGKYGQVIKSQDSGITVIERACPLFVPLVENGYTAGDAPRIIAREYLQPLIDAKVDTVILGCTHYPLLSQIICDIMGKDAALIDSGKAAASAARAQLLERDMQNSENNAGTVKYFVSDSVQGFSKLTQTLIGRDISGDVQKVNIE